MCSVIVATHQGVGPMTPPQEGSSPNPSSSSDRLDYEPFEQVDCKPATPRSASPIGAANEKADDDPSHSFMAEKGLIVEDVPIMTVKVQNSKDYCRQCGATDTPQWRNGPCGPRTLCNACGIRLHRQTQKTKQKCLRVRKKQIIKRPNRPSTSHPRSPPTPEKTMKINSRRSDDRYSSPSSEPTGQDHNDREEKRCVEISSDQKRPRRKAALAAIETTRGFTRGIRRGYGNRWKQRRVQMAHGSRRLRHFHHSESVYARTNMEPVDFTGAVDLVGLSRSGPQVHTSSGHAVAVKLEELGQDLLSHLTEIPRHAMLELQGIERELLSAHWEMQASEMAEQTVAKVACQVLDEQKQDAIRKRTRYWKARDRLEKFIHASQGMK